MFHNKRFALLTLLALVLVAAFTLPFGFAETPVTEGAYVQIESGATGEAVTRLQEKLIELGYLTVEASGTLDDDTELALMAFQSDNGLEPDGVASPELQALLFGDTEALDEAQTNAEKAEPAGIIYIGNKNTKKFHKPDCASVKDMKESNKVEISSREEAIEQGYKACKRCNP